MIRTFQTLISLIGLICLIAIVNAEEETIEDRLQPFGKICLEGQDCGTVAPVLAAGGGRSGLEIYEKFCFACHATGVSEAPLVAAEEWQARLQEKGDALLLANTKAGFNVVMPPMGTCMNCTDAELVAAIDYLITGE